MREFECVICGEVKKDQWDHNPEPISKEGRCCTDCNYDVVVPKRLELILGIKDRTDED
tara:strand:- start:318 stop:491 length:174 start_codon:yes stop_codon:yes gene_type:complete